MTEGNKLLAPLSVPTALATIQDFARANSLTGDQVLEFMALGVERARVPITEPVMTVHHVVDAAA
jgi:hypothetical protein